MNMNNGKFEEANDGREKSLEEVNNVKKPDIDKMDPNGASKVQPDLEIDEVDDTPTNDHDPSIPSEGRGVQGINMESGQNMYCETPKKK